MGIYVDTVGYWIQQVGLTGQRNRRKRVSNDGLVLGKSNQKQSKVRKNTDTLWMDVGTFNIRNEVVRHQQNVF